MENKREFKLPQTLRELMRKNPVTGEKTTMKKLAEAVGVRQKTVPLYCSGQTVPTAKLCPATADYFGVSADYLLIGREDGDLYFLWWMRSGERCMRSSAASPCFAPTRRILRSALWKTG